MPDFTLESPDDPPTRVVTGSPSERARLVSQGYRDVTDETDATDATDATGETGQTPADGETTEPAPDQAQPSTGRKGAGKTETRDQ